MKLLCVKEFFLEILIVKNGFKTNFEFINENYAGDPEIRFPTKSI